MADQPTTSQTVLHIAREALVVCLAFVGGAGAYLAAVQSPPRWPQDWAGAAAAGAVASLAKLFPTPPGGTRG